MAKKKNKKVDEPESYTSFIDRMTGVAITSLGKGDNFRDIILGVSVATLMWRDIWDKYDKENG